MRDERLTRSHAEHGGPPEALSRSLREVSVTYTPRCETEEATR